MAAGTNGLEYSVLLMFLASLGLPVGIPPEPENPVLAYVAPQECLFYTSWTAAGKPDAASSNQTEQLLAEPEIVDFSKALEFELLRNLEFAFEEQSPEQTEQLKAVVPLFLKTLASKSTAVFVSKVQTAGEAVKMDGGMIVHAGPQAEQISKGFRGLCDSYQVPYDEVQIGDSTCIRIKPPEENFPNSVTVGALGPYLLFGLGESSLEGMIARVRAKEIPAWLAQLQKDLPLERRSSISYLNVRQALATYGPGLGPQGDQLMTSLGLKGIATIETSTGLDNEGMLSRTLLRLQGEPAGLFRLVEGEGIKPADLKHIPGDAAVAGAIALNSGKTYDLIYDLVSQNAPGGEEMMRDVADGFQQSTGLGLREEALLALGDSWTFHVSPVDGWFTGLTFSVGVNDPQKLRLLETKFMESMNGRAPPGANPPMSVETVAFGGHEIRSVKIREFPMQPSWCVANDRLYITLFPAALKTIVGAEADKPLFAQPAWAKALEQGPVLSVSHQDAAASFEMLYTYASLLLPTGINAYNQQALQNGGPQLSFSMASLPSARSIHRHLLPSTSIVRKTDLGIEIQARRTMSGLDASSAIPLGVALVLPAVQAARTASRDVQSMNNMKQIGLAVHNFHDTYNGFPPAYLTSEAGKPQLSWRVLILPYIEQSALYEQFHLDEPWDSDHNKKLIPLMPQVYLTPFGGAAPGKTVYLGVAGKDGIFVPPKGNGKMWRPAQTFASVPDGTSNTVMVVEVAPESAVIWTKPDDYEFNAEKPFHDLAKRRNDSFLALRADGSVARLQHTMSAKNWEYMLNKRDGMVIEQE